jgi:flagellar basal body-associated protein FliL
LDALKQERLSIRKQLSDNFNRMSEEATPKKKGGKLPILIALVAMLITGGFFGLKMSGGKGDAEKPAPKMGEIVLLKDFLVNLQDGSYLRTEIGLGLVEGYGHEKFDKLKPAIESTVRGILERQNRNTLFGADQQDQLARELAHAVNVVLDEDYLKGKGGAEKGEDDEKKSAKPHESHFHADGPVLKVYFTSLVTQ